MAETQKKAEVGLDIHRGTIEGVILVGGRPQIEQADMPLSLSFNSIEELEQFCKMARKMGREQH